MTDKFDQCLIGAHTSASGGVENALLNGQEIGATTIQLFTANQKRWKGRELTDEMVKKWEKALEQTGIKEIMSHDSYLINLAAPNPEVLVKSRQAFKEELLRCHKLGITYLNFHPGASLKDDPQECLDRIIESLLEIEELVAKGKTRLLLEATAGQGSTLGAKFEELGYVIEGVKERMPIGVCIDTCHIFAAGYDIRTEDAWNKTLKEFDEKVGLEHLYAFHVNDSKKALGSRVDRHSTLGDGEIGIEAFKVLMNHPKTKALPKYLETPGGHETWEKEIPLLRSFVK